MYAVGILDLFSLSYRVNQRYINTDIDADELRIIMQVRSRIRCGLFLE